MTEAEIEPSNTATKTASPQPELTESEKLLAKLLSQLDPSLIQNETLKQFLTKQDEFPLDFDKITILDKIPTYNWEILSVAFESIYNDYTNEMKDVIKKFEEIDFKRSMWQESAHRMDGERSTKRFSSIEGWISNSEGYLETLRQDLLSSVDVIKTTMYKFPGPADEQHVGEGANGANDGDAASLIDEVVEGNSATVSKCIASDDNEKEKDSRDSPLRMVSGIEDSISVGENDGST